MVARLRGRPSPRPPGPNEAEEEIASKAPKTGASGQRALVAVTVFSLVAATAATGTLLYFTYGPGRVQAVTTDMPTASTGPLVELGPFIVNLGNVNERRYLRVGLSLDFQTRDPAFTQASDNARATWVSSLKAKLKHKEAIFKDVIVTTLSAKQAENLGSTTGKEELKAELTARLNRYMEGENAHVMDVYFTDFMIQ